MQFQAGFPFAFHTVGSAMVCTSDSYLKKGRMNKRKAGEDFYFMQKFIKDQVCGNITETTIIPSSRSSDRVPFGTGRAIMKYQDQEYKATTYNPKSFFHLKSFNEFIDTFYDQPNIEYNSQSSTLHEFLQNIKFDVNLKSCLKHTANKQSYLKRFYQYFDAFTLMKCLHYMRTEFPDIYISDAAHFYTETYQNEKQLSLKNALITLRKEEINRFRANN